MHEKPRVNVKVETRSTFTFTSDLPYIVSNLFTHVKPIKLYVRTHVKITRQWKSTFRKAAKPARRSFSGLRSFVCSCSNCLRWLKTVSSSNIPMGYCNHSLSLDATIMVSKQCPTIGEHFVVLFIT